MVWVEDFIVVEVVVLQVVVIGVESGVVVVVSGVGGMV